METKNIVGQNLRKIRGIAGFTQDQIATLIEIKRSTYGNYESGAREIPIEVIERVSSLFGCEPYLLFEDNVDVEDAILASAFRINVVEKSDLEAIADFKGIVLSYLKMDRLHADKA